MVEGRGPYWRSDAVSGEATINMMPFAPERVNP
jgi:hypothetical protein